MSREHSLKCMTDMRNYFFSVTVHVILLLILLGISTVTNKKEREEVIHTIMVDFSQVEEQTIVESNKNSEKTPVKARSAEVQSPNSEKTPDPVAKRVKTFEQKTLQTSQKPQANNAQILEEKSPVVKKIIPPTPPQPSPEELEAVRKKKEKEQKRAQFDALLSKAKNKTATDQNRSEKVEEVTGAHTGASPKPSFSNDHIRGVLGKRRVLKVPTIKDDSQKKGRVVVKICVNGAGKVISSKYTMMGSTTSDLYLIELAEKGAMQYLFSPSDNPKECGNVIIDFKLK